MQVGAYAMRRCPAGMLISSRGRLIALHLRLDLEAPQDWCLDDQPFLFRDDLLLLMRMAPPAMDLAVKLMDALKDACVLVDWPNSLPAVEAESFANDAELPATPHLALTNVFACRSQGLQPAESWVGQALKQY